MTKKVLIRFGLVILLTSLSMGSDLRLLPHVPSPDGGFKAKLILNNASSLPKTIVLSCYAKSGLFLEHVVVPLEPSELKKVPVDNLLPSETSHVVVQGSSRVCASIAYESTVGEPVNSLVTEIGSQKGEVRIVPSVPAGGKEFWEGAAVVSTGDKSGLLMVDLIIDGIKGPPGQAWEIQPFEKRIFMFSDLFPDSASFENVYFKISSDQPFSVMGLAGTQDHRVIWPVVPNSNPQHDMNAFSELDVLSLQVDSYKILDLSLEEELLRVSIETPQQCEESIICYMSGGFMESNPVQVNMTLQRVVDKDLPCLEVVYQRDRVFDLSPLVQDYIDGYGSEGNININFFDHEGLLLDQLEYRPQN